MNSKRAYTLFNIGATHSFVSKRLAVDSEWNVERGENDLIVTLPDGLK